MTKPKNTKENKDILIEIRNRDFRRMLDIDMLNAIYRFEIPPSQCNEQTDKINETEQ